MREVRINEDWEREALNWIGWARTPGHDVYWRYRETFFELAPSRCTAVRKRSV